MIADAVIAVVALFAHAVLSTRSVRDAARRGDAPPASLMFLALALAVWVRFVATAPSFVHANFHGMSLVDSALAFPAPPTHRPEYGVVGFAALGLVAHALGGGLDGVLLANVGFGSLACLSLALFVRSVTGRDAAFVVTAVLCACSPALARIAHAEDVHDPGLFFFGVGLYALDRHLVRGRREDLVLAVGSAIAMIGTRQTFLVLVPVFALHLLARVGLRRALRGPLGVGVALVVAACVLRLVDSVRHPSDATTYRFAADLLRTPGVARALVRNHGLVDVARFGFGTPVLVLAAFVAACARPGPPRALALAFFLAVVVTLPFGFPIPGVEYAFRLPVHTLAPVLVGVGLVPSRGGRRVDTALGLAVALAVATTVASPSFRALGRSSADLLEARYLERHVHRLAPGARLYVPQPAGRAPAYALGRFPLAARPDVRIVDVRPPADVPTYVLLGARCHGYSIEEFGPPGLVRGGRPDPDAARRFVRAVYDRDLEGAGLRPPRAARPDCQALTRESVAVAPDLRVDPFDDRPFVVYGGPFSLSLRRLRPAPSGPGRTD